MSDFQLRKSNRLTLVTMSLLTMVTVFILVTVS